MVPVSVNLSRQHFRDPNFLDTFGRIASSFKIPDKILEFELTESIFFDNQQIKTVRETIQEMHRMGFLCSLDDFGSGFSSLGLLKEFDVDTLKLDRSFFLNMSGQKAKDVISCLIDLSRHLKVKTVAEGIESMEQVELLGSMGCDMIQGYVFSAPIPVMSLRSAISGTSHRFPVALQVQLFMVPACPPPAKGSKTTLPIHTSFIFHSKTFYTNNIISSCLSYIL